MYTAVYIKHTNCVVQITLYAYIFITIELIGSYHVYVHICIVYIDICHSLIIIHLYAHIYVHIQVVASPGDIIYYPVDFWHQTVNLDTPSIAVTGMYVYKMCTCISI